MIIDAHTHSWPARGRYQDLIRELDAAGVDAAVVVSAALYGDRDNNEYVAGAVAACPGRLCQFVDVDSRWSGTYHRAGAPGRLASLCDRPAAPAGVSHYLAADNDGWLRSGEGRAFFAAADRRGLAVSLAAPPAWFADVREVTAAFPATPVLLNHLALVMLHPDGMAAGLDVVRQGAGLPNLIVKVSGYYYGSGDNRYPFAGRLEIVRAFYETWGPHRMVWASDYPASAPHLSYRQSLDVIREQAGFIDPVDLPLILGDTMRGLLRVNAGSRLAGEQGGNLRLHGNLGYVFVP